MPKFKTGRKLLYEKNGGGGFQRDFVPFFSLKDSGDSAYLQFLTGPEDIALVEIHRFVKVKYLDNDGKLSEGRRDFVARVDGLFDDGDGTDWTKVMEEIGHEADEKFAGVAVKLEPIFKGETQRVGDIRKMYVAGRWVGSEERRFYPDYEIVWMAAGNFWRRLDSYDQEIGSVTDQPFKVVREGEKTETEYMFYAVKDVPIYVPADDEGDAEETEVTDWGNFNIPSVQDVLEMLGSHERYEKYFGDESMWIRGQVPKFSKKNKGKNLPTRKNNDDDASETQADGDSESAFSRLKRRASAS